MARGTKRIDWLNHGLEFIVVIIGILIAFQLNQCSTDKQQRKTVQIHLQQIDEEASFNKWSIGNSIKLVENNTRKLDSIFIFLDRAER